MRDVTALVVQAQAGEREALAQVIAAVQDDIWRLQRSRARSEADAEDATQETFARMIASIGELRDPRTFAGWLVRIALNEARGAARRRGADAKAANALAAAASTFSEDREAGAMERAELRESVKRAVGGLDPDLRTAVELRYEHGLSYADIARAMECPEGTVADRLHTAHDRLRRALAGAGIALALAALETELSAEPAVTAPEELGKRLARLARQAPMGRPGTMAKPGARPRALKVLLGSAALVAILAGLAAWRIRRSPALSAGIPASSGTVATAAPGDGTPGTASEARGTATTPATVPQLPAAPLGGVLGYVFDADGGGPIAGAVVTAKFHTNRNLTASAVSDSRGAWSLDLAPGDWELDAQAAEFVPLSITLIAGQWSRGELVDVFAKGPQGFGYGPRELPTYDLVSVTEGAETPRDLRLHRGARVGARVTDRSGRPLAGVRATFVRHLMNTHTPRRGFFRDDYLAVPATTGVDGRFAFTGVSLEGALQLRLDGDSLVSRAFTIEINGEEPVATMDQAATIPGTLLNSFGKPVPGARFFAITDCDIMNVCLDEVSVPVDDVGRFEIPPGAAGSQLLVVWAPGYGPKLVDLTHGQPDRIDVRLQEATAVLQGRVHDERGFPIVGAQVRVSSICVRLDAMAASLAFEMPFASWYGQDGAMACLPGSAFAPLAETHADGTFRLEGVASDASVELYVTAPGFQLKRQPGDPSRETDVELVPEQEEACGPAAGPGGGVRVKPGK